LIVDIDSNGALSVEWNDLNAKEDKNSSRNDYFPYTPSTNNTKPYCAYGNN